MTVSWIKVSKTQKITKYEVRYRMVGTTEWKTKLFKASVGKYTFKKLTKGATYEVQVRSYKTVGGIKYYSAWSPIKVSGVIK